MKAIHFERTEQESHGPVKITYNHRGLFFPDLSIILYRENNGLKNYLVENTDFSQWMDEINSLIDKGKDYGDLKSGNVHYFGLKEVIVHDLIIKKVIQDAIQEETLRLKVISNLENVCKNAGITF